MTGALDTAPPSPTDRASALHSRLIALRGDVEHDGGIPREWGEGLAQLDPSRPRGDAPLGRWRQFINAARLFLVGPFAAQAAALGWGPHDLFGCNSTKPFARINQAGLLWLLNEDSGRGEVLIPRVRQDSPVALTENTAAIETPTGARQTYRRKPIDPGRALAWELSP